VAPYEAETVDFTNASTAIAGNGTTFTSAMAGRKIAKGYDYPWYEIASFTDTTNLVLDRNYLEDSESAADYVIYEDRYFLADMDCPIMDEFRVFKDGEDYPLVDRTAGGWNAFPRSEGTPTQIRLIEESGGTPRVQLWPVPDDVYAVHYKYLKQYTEMVSPSATTGMPESRTDVIIAGALANAYRLNEEYQKGAAEDARFERLLRRAISRERKRTPAVVRLRPLDQPSGMRRRTFGFYVDI